MKKHTRVPETRDSERTVQYDERPGDLALVCMVCEHDGGVSMRAHEGGAGLGIYLVSPCEHTELLLQHAYEMWTYVTQERLDGVAWPMVVSGPDGSEWSVATARWFRGL